MAASRPQTIERPRTCAPSAGDPCEARELTYLEGLPGKSLVSLANAYHERHGARARLACVTADTEAHDAQATTQATPATTAAKIADHRRKYQELSLIHI